MDILTSILVILQGGISLANKITAQVETRRKIQNGIDKQVRASLEDANAKISKAICVRREAKRKFEKDGLPKDYKYFRD